MTPRSWIRDLFARTPRTGRRAAACSRPAVRPRLCLEEFEERLVPAGVIHPGTTPFLNTAPTITCDQETVTVTEGAAATNSGRFSDQIQNTVVNVTASLGTVTSDRATGIWSWSYTPPDGRNGPTTVTITATDLGGVPDADPVGPLSATTTFTLNVSNVAPTITSFTVPATATEGSPVSLSASATDPGGAYDPLGYTWTVTRPDGGTLLAGGPTLDYTPAENGLYSVLLRVSDDDGGSVLRSTTLNVSNVAPTITSFTVPATATEGSPVSLSASATDPGGAYDPLNYTWTVIRPDGRTIGTVPGASTSFIPPDNGTYGVILTVSDGDGGRTVSTPFLSQVSWWRGEGDANDMLSANDGTRVGGVGFAPGKFGQAFRLNGSNRVEAADASALDLTAAVTLEAWVNPDTLAFNNGYGAVIAKSSGGARNYGLFVRSDGGLHLSYFTTGGANVILDSPAGLVPAGEFTHLAAVIDTVGGSMQIYRNGNLMASRATGGPLLANAAPLTIGSSDPGLDYGFRGLIDEPAVYNRALSPFAIQFLASAAPAAKLWEVAVDNTDPTPTLSGPSSGLATQVLPFILGATDPSIFDGAAGFDYTIDWGDGSPVQTIARTAGNGIGFVLSHRFATAGSYTVNLAAFDKDGGVADARHTVTVRDMTATNLQAALSQQGSISTQATTDAQAQALVSAVNGLSAQTTPVMVTMNLGAGTYSGSTANPPAGTTLVISGSGGTTIIVGHSPSLEVTGGNVILSDVTLTNDTDAPTILVSGGNLTLRNVVVQESTVGSQAALLVTGGSADISDGGNTFNVNGPGELIRNTGAAPVSAVGTTFQLNGALASDYRIEDAVFHALDAGGGGLVTWKAGNVYVTTASGSVQRGVGAVAAGGTVNVEAGRYAAYAVGGKLLTVAFQGGPSLALVADDLNPGRTALTVAGTSGNDHMVFSPGGSAGVAVAVNGLPAATFAPTGRLVACGLAGDDDIQVAGSITLPAWLYGGAGDDRLKGGAGHDVLLGGAGDDLIIGGDGRDLLIGGLSADRLVGNAEDDILIAGWTLFDDDPTALAAILGVWVDPAGTYQQRVTALSVTGLGAENQIKLTAATVSDDGSEDVLTGTSGQDWYFANMVGSGVRDKITDLSAAEFVNDLEFINSP